MNENNYLTPELVEKLKTFHSSLTEDQKSKLKKQLPLANEIQIQALKKMILK